MVFFLAVYAYIGDITTEQDRTKRLAYVDAMWSTGFFLGKLTISVFFCHCFSKGMGVSGLIKKKLGFFYGFYFIFSAGIVFAVLAMLYALFLLEAGDHRSVSA